MRFKASFTFSLRDGVLPKCFLSERSMWQRKYKTGPHHPHPHPHASPLGDRRAFILFNKTMVESCMLRYACVCILLTPNRASHRKRAHCAVVQAKDYITSILTPFTKVQSHAQSILSFYKVTRGRKITEDLSTITLYTPTFPVFFWWSQVSRSSFNARLDLITICWRGSLRHTWKSM